MGFQKFSTAEVASSRLVAPSNLSKKLRLISLSLSRVQKDTFLLLLCTFFRVYFGLPRDDPYPDVSFVSPLIFDLNRATFSSNDD
jgi:hypothetical protein